MGGAFSDLNSKWETVVSKSEKALCCLCKTETYKYTTSSGVVITLKNTDDVQVFENKETDEVIVIGAKNARIKSSGQEAYVTI